MSDSFVKGNPLNKSIALDFDGCVHAYSKGYHHGECYDPPMNGAFDTIKKLQGSGYGVFILTAREDLQPVIAWFHEHEFPGKVSLIPEDTHFWSDPTILGVTNKKRPALAYVDDRAIRFTNWNDIQNYFA